MNDWAHSVASTDLGRRIAAINAAVRELSEEAERLREEARRLRALHARVHLGSRMPLWFLMRLQHENFPVRVAEPGEIRYVSVLTATGLIEAEIDPLEATAPYAASQLATVIRITEHGRAEIARIEDMPKPAATSMQMGRELR
ncbi:hypothetical protein QFZ42_002403 [Variovorax paradoxus]|uniref:hypothetical protein n=1 Tax=Variovorax paradoxus TaxID=34073 RepID=UPI0027907C38|nr:hypothetical protein [Variovorax paradoxus]MDQ0570569.1 hypothetical protein [Variovorax paradoxus]